MTPSAAPRPKALPPVRSTACTRAAFAIGLSRSVSRALVPPPRTSPDATAPSGGGSTTVQPVAASESVQWPTAKPSGSGPLIRARCSVGAAAEPAGSGGRRMSPARRRPSSSPGGRSGCTADPHADGSGTRPASSRARRWSPGSRRSRRPAGRSRARGSPRCPRAGARSRRGAGGPPGRSGWMPARNSASSA